MKPLDNQSTPNTASSASTANSQSEQLFTKIRFLRNNSAFFCGEDESDLKGQRNTLAWKSLANRSCGDSLTMAIQSDDSGPLKLVFSGYCCTLCHAAAEVVCQSFDDLFRQGANALEQPKELASIQSAVCNMPSRRKCAELPWLIVTELIEAFGNTDHSVNKFVHQAHQPPSSSKGYNTND